MLNVVQWLLLRKNMCDKNNPIIQIAYVECQSEYVRTSLFSPPLVCLFVCLLLFGVFVVRIFSIRMSLSPPSTLLASLLQEYS